ncbi:MAG: hypothetical protein Q9209_006780 [Squamulea sp. 1 TL-2023]
MTSYPNSTVSKYSPDTTLATFETQSSNTSTSEPATTATTAEASKETKEERSRAPMRRVEQMDNVLERTKPRQLLDLPLDVLKEIVEEVTNTNDLTSLALTCSAFNTLATPWIYSRFDIIWPEVNSPADFRQGVDALTYGLATLVMGETPTTAPTPINSASANRTLPPPAGAVPQRRRGNHYPQYTRKFSLGNGRDKWIKEYRIDKESGKMLGTLVALALARMPNLESLVWDMPTGILRDCWLALESLGEGKDDHSRSLEKVWVRLHDNLEIVADSDISPRIPINSPGNTTSDPSQTQWSSALRNSPNSNRLLRSYGYVEWPNFSVLPALKSLSVLDIDEPAYLEEMSVLIDRSFETLRELRVGFAVDVPRYGFASSRNIDFPNDASQRSTYKGALDLLMSKIHNLSPEVGRHSINTVRTTDQSVGYEDQLSVSIQSGSDPAPVTTEPIVVASAVLNLAETLDGLSISSSGDVASQELQTNVTKTPTALHPMVSTEVELLDGCQVSDTHDPGNQPLPNDSSKSNQEKAMLSSSNDIPPSIAGVNVEPELEEQNRLRLEVLELERVSLAVPVLLRTIDWSVVTSLTLLHCDSHERLWKAFRRIYTPRLTATTTPDSPLPSVRRKSKLVHPRKPAASKQIEIPFSEYRLNLRKLHTNTVSSALIAFLKDTLAPNSLESLFLQDGGIVDLDGSGQRTFYDSGVTVDAICRGPLKRHRCSLKKVMIDSSHRLSEDNNRNVKWRKWKLDSDALSYLTSGKMSALRELSISLDYRDWHFFLQRLPEVPHIRSIHLPYIADAVHLNKKELALQIVDIVALRPEIELCYIGILNECFKILEGTYNDDATVTYPTSTTGPLPGPGSTSGSDEDSDEEEEDEEDHDDIDQDHAMDEPQQNSDGDSESESYGESDIESEDDEKGKLESNMKLRQIQFYEDKISIFKARHCKL